MVTPPILGDWATISLTDTGDNATLMWDIAQTGL